MRKKSKNQTMGCCGCSLTASAVTAVILGLIESLVGMAWNILVIVLIETQKQPNEFDSSTHSTSSFFDGSTDSYLSDSLTTIEEVPVNDSVFFKNTDWEIFKDTIASMKAQDQAHVFELSVTSLVLNSFWLITTLALAIGNAEKCRDMLKPWIVTTVIITISDIAATVYFIFKAYKDTDGSFDNVDRLFVENIFVLLATFFSRGGPIVWMANVALCIFVAQRVKEIEIQKKRLPFDTDMRPYTSHSPFDAYGNDYRFEKNMRPHTPPPDYEARGGARDKQLRRKPSPSECETVPVSLRSGSSVAPRPSSRIYDPEMDDRVELQHRANERHHHHPHHHAYDNKALETEPPEVWLGIPRPTLKVNR